MHKAPLLHTMPSRLWTCVHDFQLFGAFFVTFFFLALHGTGVESIIHIFHDGMSRYCWVYSFIIMHYSSSLPTCAATFAIENQSISMSAKAFDVSWQGGRNEMKWNEFSNKNKLTISLARDGISSFNKQSTWLYVFMLWWHVLLAEPKVAPFTIHKAPFRIESEWRGGMPLRI